MMKCRLVTNNGHPYIRDLSGGVLVETFSTWRNGYGKAYAVGVAAPVMDVLINFDTEDQTTACAIELAIKLINAEF